MFFLYNDSTIISNTFFIEVNKNIQCYRFISLQCNHNNEKVISSKTRLRFKINYNAKKAFITLQLEDILTPKQIETEDSKITNLSTLSIAESKMQIKDEFIIVGFQNFEKNFKINPISIQITNPEIQTSLLFYAGNYKHRFNSNSLLFSPSLQKDTNVIFITTNGLNDAKELLINGKLFQAIGVIFTSEIDGWTDI